MAIHRGPKIVTNGLVMNLDSASPKSYDPSQSGTIVYSPPALPSEPVVNISTYTPMSNSPVYYKRSYTSYYTYYVYSYVDTPYGRYYNQNYATISTDDSIVTVDDFYSIKINITDDASTSGWVFFVDQDDQTFDGVGTYFKFTRAELLSLFIPFQFLIDDGYIYQDIDSSSSTNSYDSEEDPHPFPNIHTITTFEFKDLTSRNNGVAQDTTYSSNNFGSLSFNSSSGSRVTVTGAPDFNYSSGDFTWEVWAKPTADGYFLDHAPVNSGVMQRFGGILRYYNPVVGTSSSLYTGGPAITANTWYNIVASRISGTTSLYLNGDFKVSGSDPCVYPQASYLSLGSPANFLVGFFLDGQIPVSRIYKGKGLTSSEVSQNYNALKGRFGIL